MPSGSDYGASYGDADFFSPPVAGPRGGTGCRGRGLPDER